MDHLVEPLAFLSGEAAADACRAGLAQPFMGSGVAFTLARLHASGRDPHLVRACDIPPAWREAEHLVTAAPALAGLPPGLQVMGILNATPDSFSTGGQHLDPVSAVAAGRGMIADGASLLDIGGESTRPGAEPPPVGEEIRRILPLIAGLRHAGVALSVDTRRATVMEAALAAGADLINDVSALAFDPGALKLLASATCPVVLMHSRGTPLTMQSLATYDAVAVAVVRELGARIEAAVAGGIDRARIIVDPGIGFAKTASQNVELLRRLPILANLGGRVLLGVSRKSFIGRLANEPEPARRVPGTLAAAAAARFMPHVIHRVHDVRASVQFHAVAAALD